MNIAGLLAVTLSLALIAIILYRNIKLQDKNALLENRAKQFQTMFFDKKVDFETLTDSYNKMSSALYEVSLNLDQANVKIANFNEQKQCSHDIQKQTDQIIEEMNDQGFLDLLVKKSNLPKKVKATINKKGEIAWEGLKTTTKKKKNVKRKK